MSNIKKNVTPDLNDLLKVTKQINDNLSFTFDNLDKLKKKTEAQTKELKGLKEELNSIKVVQDQINKLSNIKSIGLKGLSIKKITETYSARFAQGLEKSAAYSSALTNLGKINTPEARKAEKMVQEKLVAQNKENKQLTYTTAGLKVLSATTKVVAQSMDAFFKDVKRRVYDIIDLQTGAATYNIGSSLIANTSAREQQLKYGLSAAQNYAFSKAKQMLNLSEADLPYMNVSQRTKLMDYMQRYSTWYNKMESSGILSNVQDLMLSFNELKEDLAMDFLEWIGNNKNEIMNCARGIFNAVKFTAEVILKILTAITNPFGISRASDSLSNGSSRSVVNNVNINSTSNISGTATNIAAREESMWSDLAKQITGAIGV